MKYKELLENLQKLNEEALSKDAIVWDVDDEEFKDVEFSGINNCEIEKPADQLNDEDYFYFVI